MKDDIKSKRSVTVGGRRTSISLSDADWERLREIARSGGYRGVSALVADIDRDRDRANLSQAVRVYVITTTIRDALTRGAGAQPAW